MSDPRPNGARRNLLRIGVTGTTGLFGAGGAQALYSFLDPPIDDMTENRTLRLSESERYALAPGTMREYRIGARTLWLCCLKRTDVQRSELFEQGIVMDDRVIFALDARCPHLGCTVSPDPTTGLLRCPCHHSVFGPDGTRRDGPAERDMTIYPIELSDRSRNLRG